MNRNVLYIINFFFITIACHAQKVHFEPEKISVPKKTTHEISFTDDGQTLYFTQTVDNKWRKSQIGYKSSLSHGEWSRPVKVKFVDSLYNMSVSPDGKMILFCKDDKSWMSLKKNEKWSTPIDLNEEYDFSFNGGYYHILNDYSFYFSGVQENESHPYDDIYYVEFKDDHYKKPKRLSANINTQATEFSPWVNKENNLIIFSRYDPSSEANTGIFFSKLRENKWQKAQKVNALEYGWGVFVRENTNTLYYTANGIIYAFDLDLLDID